MRRGDQRQLRWRLGCRAIRDRTAEAGSIPDLVNLCRVGKKARAGAYDEWTRIVFVGAVGGCVVAREGGDQGGIPKRRGKGAHTSASSNAGGVGCNAISYHHYIYTRQTHHRRATRTPSRTHSWIHRSGRVEQAWSARAQRVISP